MPRPFTLVPQGGPRRQACKRASTYHVGEVCLLSGRGRSAEHRPRNRSPDRYAVFNSAARDDPRHWRDRAQEARARAWAAVCAGLASGPLRSIGVGAHNVPRRRRVHSPDEAGPPGYCRIDTRTACLDEALFTLVAVEVGGARHRWTHPERLMRQHNEIGVLARFPAQTLIRDNEGSSGRHQPNDAV